MKPVRFLHIPKTAGTTLNSILLRHYDEKKVFFFSGDIASDIKKYELLTKTAKEHIALFAGHAPIHTGITEADNKQIMTLLREPVSRVKSFCQHVFEGKSPHLKEAFPPESFRLDDFLMCGNNELSNLQTKMLINDGSCDSPYKIERMSPSEAKDLALDNLFNMVSCFGLQEFFDESLIIFSTFMGWKLPLYNSMNVRKPFNSIEFNENHIEKIKELNAIDISVYEAAKKKFCALLDSENFNRNKLIYFHIIQWSLHHLKKLGMNYIKN